MPDTDLYVQAWRQFERFYGEHSARAIAVSNFLVPAPDDAARRNGYLPAVNQVELHPLFQQRELHEYAGARNCGRGVGTTRPGKYDLFGIPRSSADRDRTRQVAAQIRDSLALQAGNIVITKSNSRERMQQNFEVFDFRTHSEEFATMTARTKNRRVAATRRRLTSPRARTATAPRPGRRAGVTSRYVPANAASSRPATR